MNHQSRIELTNNIHTQLELLDTSFYNIDNGLIQHPDLCKFAKNMENIINNIKTNLDNLDNLEKINCNKTNNLDYINYKQLEKLANTKIN